MTKESLRKWAKEERKKLDIKSISGILSEKLRKTEEYKNSNNIMLYYPLPNEVNLLDLLNDSSKQFYLPRIQGSELECCPYKIGNKLSESYIHTLEPVCKSCSKTILDIVIVPALACDLKNYRLGYGGGFYDRFLKNYNGKKIACIPSKLLIESIFHQEHDIKMDLVITELQTA